MSLPRQLINLLGLVVVLAVVVGGVAAVALPLYTQSMSTDGDTARVAQTNSQYDIQVQALQAAKKNLPQTQQEVAQLRTQISVPDHLDDVFEIAVKAAAATKSTVTKITTVDVEPFIARTIVGDDGKATAPKTAPAADTTTNGTATSGSATKDAAATPTPAAAPADNGRIQAPFTITVDVPSPAAAARFLDELRKGPRLVAIIHSALAGAAASGGGGAYTLTVDALAFIRSAD